MQLHLQRIIASHNEIYEDRFPHAHEEVRGKK